MKLSVYGESNDGRQRDHNEDSFLILADLEDKWTEINDSELDTTNTKGVLFVVADGMGGTNAGEVASKIAVQTVKSEFSKRESLPRDKESIRKFLVSIVHICHKKIVKEARKKSETEGMGTTIIICWIIGNKLYTTWSGDSRCYLFSPGKDQELHPLTDDHSLVWERVKKGEITSEEARLSDESNLILQSLGGGGQKPDPDFIWKNLSISDRIILCSDGLNSMLSDIGIQQIVEYENDTKRLCQSLIESANNAGGHDNITSIVIDVTDKKEDEIKTETNEPIKNKKKKIWKYLLAPIFILLILGGIYLIDDLSSTKQNISSKNLLEEMDQPGTPVESPEQTNSDPVIPEERSVSVIDTTSIRDTLEKAIEELLLVKEQLMAEEQNRDNLIELFSQVSLLETQISQITNYTSGPIEGSEELQIHDYSMAGDMYLEFLNACQELRKSIESMRTQEE